MGILIFLMGTQLMSLALVLWAVASRGLSAGARRASMAVTLVAACGLFAIIRTDGVSTSLLGSDYHWRWTPTAEEMLLARAAEEPKPLPPAPAVRFRDAGNGSRRGACDGSRAAPGLATPTGPAMSGEDRPRARRLPSRMAWIPRPVTRQRHSWRSNQQRLVGGAARSDLAQADRAGLVVVRRARRPDLHAGAARRRRDRRRATGCRPGSPCGGIAIAVRFYESNGGAGSARDADHRQRPRLRPWRDRHSERARRAHGQGAVVAQRLRRHRRASARPGVSRVRRWSSTIASSSPRRARLSL